MYCWLNDSYSCVESSMLYASRVIIDSNIIMIYVSPLNTYRNDEVNKPFVNVPDSAWHFTPLHYACCYNNKNIIQLLLDAGADPNARYYSLTYAWYNPDHSILCTSHSCYTSTQNKSMVYLRLNFMAFYLCI